MTFLVLSHALSHEGRDVFGPAHNVVEHLSGEGHPADLVLHPLGGGPGETIHRTFRFGELVAERRYRVRGRPGEILDNIRLIRSIGPSVVIAVDPLNQLGSWLGSRRPHRPVNVYYTADYARRRFENPALNAVYHRLDRFALRTCDATWSVSDAISAQRAAQGVPAAKRLVVPNAPPFDETAVVPWHEREPDSLVFVGMLDPIFDWDLLLDGLSRVMPHRPALTVHLVGDGSEATRLRDAVAAHGMTGAVTFHGLLPHRDALARVATARIGLALYSGLASWNEYGDSLKVREYFSRGLPVVSTASHPLADALDARGAGAVVASGAQLAAAVERLLETAEGTAAAAAALEFARETDRTSAMGRAVEDLRHRLTPTAERHP